MKLKSRTTFIELTFEQCCHRYWMLSAFRVAADNVARDGMFSSYLVVCSGTGLTVVRRAVDERVQGQIHCKSLTRSCETVFAVSL